MMLYAGGDNLLKIFLGNKEFLYCKQTCNADYAHDVADSIGVVDNNVSCYGKNKNLDRVCRCKIDKHAYELKSDYDSKHVVQEVRRVGKVAGGGEDV